MALKCSYINTMVKLWQGGREKDCNKTTAASQELYKTQTYTTERHAQCIAYKNLESYLHFLNKVLKISIYQVLFNFYFFKKESQMCTMFSLGRE